MTKVEVNGKTYCVETLIYEIERLTKEVKASTEYHRLILDEIKKEMEYHRRKTQSIDPYDLVGDCLDIIEKYKV